MLGANPGRTDGNDKQVAVESRTDLSKRLVDFVITTSVSFEDPESTRRQKHQFARDMVAGFPLGVRNA